MFILVCSNKICLMFPSICLEFMHRAFGAPVGWVRFGLGVNFLYFEIGLRACVFDVWFSLLEFSFWELCQTARCKGHLYLHVWNLSLLLFELSF